MRLPRLFPQKDSRLQPKPCTKAMADFKSSICLSQVILSSSLLAIFSNFSINQHSNLRYHNSLHEPKCFFLLTGRKSYFPELSTASACKVPWHMLYCKIEIFDVIISGDPGTRFVEIKFVLQSCTKLVDLYCTY